MFHFQIKCSPLEGNEYYGKIEGAYASAYIDFKNPAGAFVLAEYFVSEDFWEITEIISYANISEEELEQMEDDSLKIIREHGVFIHYMMFGEANE